MRRYVDVLDANGAPVDARVPAALGPRMLDRARERSAGTHPYLTIPAQTSEARSALGPGALVAPEQTIVLDPNTNRGRATARSFLGYLEMTNYAGNMRRAGFSAEDVSAGGSDALVDQIVVHGHVAVVARASDVTSTSAQITCASRSSLEDRAR